MSAQFGMESIHDSPVVKLSTSHPFTNWMTAIIALDKVKLDNFFCIFIYCLIHHVAHSHILSFTQNEVYNETDILWNGVHVFFWNLSMCLPQHAFVNCVVMFWNIIHSTTGARLHPLSTPANQILEPPFTDGHINPANHSFATPHTTFSELAGRMFLPVIDFAPHSTILFLLISGHEKSPHLLKIRPNTAYMIQDQLKFERFVKWVCFTVE